MSRLSSRSCSNIFSRTVLTITDSRASSRGGSFAGGTLELESSTERRPWESSGVISPPPTIADARSLASGTANRVTRAGFARSRVRATSPREAPRAIMR